MSLCEIVCIATMEPDERAQENLKLRHLRSAHNLDYQQV